MNLFSNFLGGRHGHGEGNDCCCTIIWLLFLLSICGNGFDICDILPILVIILLLGSCGNGFGDMGGCRG